MGKSGIDITALTVPERIQLAEELWDSVAAEGADIPLTSAQVEEIDRRLEDLERHPDVGERWEAVRARLEERIRHGVDDAYPQSLNGPNSIRRFTETCGAHSCEDSRTASSSSYAMTPFA